MSRLIIPISVYPAILVSEYKLLFFSTNILTFRSFVGYGYNQHRALCQIQITHKTIKETFLYFQSD